jgi:lipopolysaccharide transport system permease protein
MKSDNVKNGDVTIIAPSKGWHLIDFKELFRYRELLYFLTWRDIKVRYKQTLLGAAWAILKPFLSMIVFTVFFGKMAKVPSEGIPYPIFSYAGLVLWTYFSGSVSMASNSLVGQSRIITKVYFPRLSIPLASTLSGLVDYLISIIILVVMMFFYRMSPGINLIFVPFLVFFAFLSASGIGFWLSAINVKYRDVRYAVPFLIQMLLFATPVIYSPTILPEKYRWLLSLNPISGIIEAHRSCILGHQPINWLHLGISIGMTLFFFVLGAFYFKRMEKYFADII